MSVVSVGRSWQETKKLSPTLSTWINKKKEQFGNIHDVDNAINSLTLESAILDLMVKLKEEMTRELPDCLMKCYLYGKVLQIHG